MKTKMHRQLLAALFASTAFASLALAHETNDQQRGKELFQPGLKHAAEQSDAAMTGRPALYKGLGTMTMPVTTRSKQAQAYFNQGWVLAWGFNHAEARRAFREAQRLDPGFAMAYWGEAFVLGPNLNDIMHDDAVVPAHAAIARAMALREGVTEKEKALIEALAARYGANPMANRSALDVAWAERMKAVAARFGEDANVLTLYADAMMNLQPWDYWEADGVTAKKNGAEIVKVLETALAIDQGHVAAAHLYIHAVEASSTPERAEAVADRLRGATPDVAHLLHMPSHIYLRVGRHADGIAVNRDAVVADEKLLRAAGKDASAIVRYGYYPHNVHFLMVSAQMAGVADSVFSAAEKLDKVMSDDVAAKLAWVQAIKTATYAAHAQFADAETTLALKRPDAKFPFVQGFWHYARGVAFASRKEWGKAEAEADAIAALIATADMSVIEAQFLPAKNVLALAKHVVEARIAQAKADYATAEAHLRKAAELEAAMPYIEPPYWYYPVQQTLGAVLLQQGRAREAADTFKAALKQRPRNGWALWGLMQAQTALGDEQAKATEVAFKRAWLGDRTMLTLDRL